MRIDGIKIALCIGLSVSVAINVLQGTRLLRLADAGKEQNVPESSEEDPVAQESNSEADCPGSDLQLPRPDSRPRKRRPAIVRKESIADYHPQELISLIDWINSDGCLRTDEEIIELMIPELGFSRRGPRIEAAIRSALDLMRASRDRPGPA